MTAVGLDCVTLSISQLGGSVGVFIKPGKSLKVFMYVEFVQVCTESESCILLYDHERVRMCKCVVEIFTALRR